MHRLRMFLCLTIIAILCSLIGCYSYDPRSYNVHPEFEMKMKQDLMKQDVTLTDELCRSQCSLDFSLALVQIKSRESKEVKGLLEKMRTEHPHMDQLIWSYNGQPYEQGIVTGSPDNEVSERVNEYYKEAKQAVESGNSYESPRIEQGDKTYFVLGIPAADGQSSLIGLIHQEVLHKVKVHQRKNLRLVPYPSDARWKIESVDSETLSDVKVRHPQDNKGTSHYHVNEVVVKFKKEPEAAQLQQIQNEISAHSVQKLGYTYVFRSAGMEAKELMGYFQKWDVEYVEPHFLYLTNEIDALAPNDALYARYQWNLPSIDTLRGWQWSHGSEDIIVGVIDTGVDLNHPDLSNRTVRGYNFVEEDKPPMDDVGHGTHVAGIISALVNNREGVAGISWNNPVMPVKALDHTGAGSTYSVAQSIIWATDQGAKVINMSLGNYADAQFLHDAVKYAFDRDVLLIAASGNDNTETPGYPAAYPEVFAVAATDALHRRALFSNYGEYIDVAAPGVSIASTFPNNQYAALSGTSMASPHVAALAALIRSINPLLSNTEVMEIMRQTATDLGEPGKDMYYGYGEINVAKSLEYAQRSSDSLSLLLRWLNQKLQQRE